METGELVNAVADMMNPRIERLGVSKMRMLTRHAIRRMKGPIFVESPDSPTPIAVVVPYASYLRVQNVLFGRPE